MAIAVTPLGYRPPLLNRGYAVHNAFLTAEEHAGLGDLRRLAVISRALWWSTLVGLFATIAIFLTPRPSRIFTGVMIGSSFALLFLNYWLAERFLSEPRPGRGQRSNA